MNSLLKADVFFFITTIAVILISAGVLVAVFYVIKILRDAWHIADRVKEESDAILDDVDGLRHAIRQDGFKLRGVMNLFKKRLRVKHSKQRR